jgi:hypothetical protein
MATVRAGSRPLSPRQAPPGTRGALPRRVGVGIGHSHAAMRIAPVDEEAAQNRRAESWLRPPVGVEGDRDRAAPDGPDCGRFDVGRNLLVWSRRQLDRFYRTLRAQGMRVVMSGSVSGLAISRSSRQPSAPRAA